MTGLKNPHELIEPPLSVIPISFIESNDVESPSVLAFPQIPKYEDAPLHLTDLPANKVAYYPVWFYPSNKIVIQYPTTIYDSTSLITLVEVAYLIKKSSSAEKFGIAVGFVRWEVGKTFNTGNKYIPFRFGLVAKPQNQENVLPPAESTDQYKMYTVNSKGGIALGARIQQQGSPMPSTGAPTTITDLSGKIIVYDINGNIGAGQTQVSIDIPAGTENGTFYAMMLGGKLTPLTQYSKVLPIFPAFSLGFFNGYPFPYLLTRVGALFTKFTKNNFGSGMVQALRIWDVFDTLEERDLGVDTVGDTGIHVGQSNVQYPPIYNFETLSTTFCHTPSKKIYVFKDNASYTLSYLEHDGNNLDTVTSATVKTFKPQGLTQDSSATKLTMTFKGDAGLFKHITHNSWFIDDDQSTEFLSSLTMVSFGVAGLDPEYRYKFTFGNPHVDALTLQHYEVFLCYSYRSGPTIGFAPMFYGTPAVPINISGGNITELIFTKIQGGVTTDVPIQNDVIWIAIRCRQDSSATVQDGGYDYRAEAYVSLDVSLQIEKSSQTISRFEYLTLLQISQLQQGSGIWVNSAIPQLKAGTIIITWAHIYPKYARNMNVFDEKYDPLITYPLAQAKAPQIYLEDQSGTTVFTDRIEAVKIPSSNVLFDNYILTCTEAQFNTWKLVIYLDTDAPVAQIRNASDHIGTSIWIHNKPANIN